MEQEQFGRGNWDPYVWLETRCGPGGGPILMGMERDVLYHRVTGRESLETLAPRAGSGIILSSLFYGG